MAINSIPIARRTLPFDSAIEANGNYTLPRHAFIPNPAIQPFSGSMVAGPGAAQISANFDLPGQIASRPYPTPVMPAVYGLRTVTLKTSPTG
jgi:hypothetical protein